MALYGFNPNSSLPYAAPKNIYTDRQLSSNDLLKIRQKYGENIQDILELEPGQKWMLQARRNNKSAFFLQMLLRAEMELVPEQFENKVNRVCEDREALRFAYVYRGMDRPHCVELKKRNAEIIFRDLSSVSEEDLPEKLEVLCEADRRRGFDLENDSLLRITVLKLANKNEYAFIISQPHINSDGTSIGILIKDIFIDYVLGIEHAVMADADGAFKRLAAYRSSVNIDEELGYWREYLQGVTEEIRLPGIIDSKDEFDERVYLTGFREDTQKALEGGEKRYKVTLYNLLQAAWGVMLNRITGRSDILFGAITSGRDAAALQSMMIPGGFIRVVPVRVHVEDGMTYGETAKKVQQDFAASMKYSHCTLEQIGEAIGRKTPLFNHILNCHNFTGNESTRAGGLELPGFKLLSGTAYDNLSENLAVYIRQGAGGLELGIGYNGAVFAKETVELYAETYKKVIDQIFLQEEDIPIGRIDRIDAALFEYTAQLKQMEYLKKTMLLSKTAVFRNVEWNELMAAAAEAELRTYQEADSIFRADACLDSLPIMISGYAELVCRSKDGWDNPVKICKAGEILSMAGLVGAARAEIAAIAGSKEVTVLSVPCREVRRLSARYPEINEEIIRILDRESMNYKKMWVNL